MNSGFLRRGRRLAVGFALALSLVLLARPAPADPGDETGQLLGARFGSTKLAWTAVTQTGSAISARINALLGGAAASPLALSPGRRVRLLELGNAGQELNLPIDERTRAILDEEELTLADGSLATPYGFWADGAWSRFGFDDNGTSFSGDVWSGLIGADYEVNDRFIVGLAGAYGTQNFDVSIHRGAVSGSSIEMSPYMVYRLGDDLSIDFSGGYAWLDYTDTHWDEGLGRWTQSGTGASRWFTAINVNLSYPVDQWRFDGRIGSLYAAQDVNAPYATDTMDAQVMTVGNLHVGYVFDVFGGLEPYVAASGRYNAEDGIVDNGNAVVSIGTSLSLGSASVELRGSTYEATGAPSTYSGLLNVRIGL